MGYSPGRQVQKVGKFEDWVAKKISKMGEGRWNFYNRQINPPLPRQQVTVSVSDLESLQAREWAKAWLRAGVMNDQMSDIKSEGPVQWVP